MYNLVRLKALPVLRALLVCVFMGTIQADNSVSTAIALDLNRKIVLGGYTNNVSNNTSDFALARVNPDGTPDTTFAPFAAVPGQLTLDIQGTNDILTALAIDANNKIVAVGSSQIAPQTQNAISTTNTEFAVVRFNADGTLDATFNQNGLLGPTPGIALIRIGQFSDTANAVAIDAAGRIVVAGTTDNGRNTECAIVRLTPNGQLDTTFNPQSTTIATSTIGTSPGNTSTISTSTPGILIISVNGLNDSLTGVAITATQKIVVGGTTTTSTPEGNLTDLLIIQLNTDGTIDTTFNQFTLEPGFVIQSVESSNLVGTALKIDSMGKIVIAGAISNLVNGAIMNATKTEFLLARYNPDGTLDTTTFNPDSTEPLGPGIVTTKIATGNSAILGLAIDSQNNILATGYSEAQNTANGTSLTNVFTTARYLNDGSLDIKGFNATSSTPGIVITNLIPPNTLSGGANQGQGVVVDAAGNIIVTGFSSDGNQNNFTTIEYLATGAINTSFDANGPTPGILITEFGGEQNVAGNGVPLNFGGSLYGIDPEILEGLRYAPTTILPQIAAEGPIITNDPEPTLSGLAGPNSIMTLYVNDYPLTVTTANATGAWTATLPSLVEGTYSVTAVAADPLTGISLASVPVSLTIASEAPQPPIITVPGQGQKLKTARVRFEGTAVPDMLVSISINDVEVGRVRADRSGFWTFLSVPLDDKDYVAYAVTTDAAGNVSLPSDVVPFTIETELVTAPRILFPTKGFATNKPRVVVSGEGTPGKSITLYVNEKAVANVKIGSRGAWSYTLSDLADGSYVVYAKAEKKVSSEKIPFTVETVPPKPVTNVRVKPSGLIYGNAQPQGLISLYFDGTLLGKTVADDHGAWSFTPLRGQKLPSGPQTIKISVADAAGNISSVVEQKILL